MMNFLKKLWKDEEGQDLIEYGLLLALITLATITSIGTIGDKVADIFSNAASLIP
jgi:pilus assembly protein Flp/PilA